MNCRSLNEWMTSDVIVVPKWIILFNLSKTPFWYSYLLWTVFHLLNFMTSVYLILLIITCTEKSIWYSNSDFLINWSFFGIFLFTNLWACILVRRAPHTSAYAAGRIYRDSLSPLACLVPHGQELVQSVCDLEKIYPFDYKMSHCIHFSYI